MSDSVSIKHRGGGSTLPLADLDAEQEGLDLAWPSICENIDCGACRKNISNIEDFLALPSSESIADHDTSTITSDNDSGVEVDASPIQGSAASEEHSPPTSVEPEPTATPSSPAENGSPIEEPTRHVYEGLCTIHPIHEVEDFVKAIDRLRDTAEQMHPIFSGQLLNLGKRLDEQKGMIDELAAAKADLQQQINSRTAELQKDLTGVDAKISSLLGNPGVNVMLNQPGMDPVTRFVEQLKESEKKAEHRVKVLEDEVRSLKAALAATTGTETTEARLLALEKKADSQATKQGKTYSQETRVKKYGFAEPEVMPPPQKKAKLTPQGSSARGKEPSIFPANQAVIASFKTPAKALERLHQRHRETGRAAGRRNEDEGAAKYGRQ